MSQTEQEEEVEVNKQEQVPEVSGVEKTALILKVCALSSISKEPRKVEQPCPVTHLAIVADVVRKLRKME